MLVFLLVTAVVTLAVLLVVTHLMTVRPYTGDIISRFGKPIRSVGPGLRWIWWWEEAEEEIPLEKISVPFEGEFETKGKDPVDLKIIYEYMPCPSRLIQYRSFGKDPNQLKTLLTERLRSLITIITRTKKNRKEVLDAVKTIGPAVKADFESGQAENGDLLQEYYAINLLAVTITDPVLPPELKKAIIDREAVVEQNKRRGKELAKDKQMAAALVKEAERHNQHLDFEKALGFVHLKFNPNVKKDIKELGLDKNTLDFLGNVLKEIMK